MPNTQQQSPKAADSSSDIINRGALYNLLGYLGKIGRPLSMLLVPLFYGAQVNDWYILALFTYEVCVRLSESGVHKGLLIRIPAYQQETSPILVPRAIWTAFIFSALVSVIVVTITIFLASRWTSGNELEFLRWFVVAIPFTVGTNVLCHATMAQKTMKYQVLIKKIGDPVFVFSFIAIVGLLKLPPLSVVFAILCSSMATMVWAAWAVSRLYDFRAIIRVGLQGHFDRDLILFSFPLGLGDFLNKLLFSMDVFALRYFGVPGGYLGIYGLASRLVNVFREIRKLFDPLITPIFSEHYQKKNLPVVEELIHRLTMWVTALVVPIMMFLIVF